MFLDGNCKHIFDIDAFFKRFEPELVVFKDQSHHFGLFFERGVGIDLVESILMQVVFADGFCGFHRPAVFCAERVHTDKSDDFVQSRLVLQNRHKFLTHYVPFLAHIIGVPVGKPVCVKRITLNPVDCREVTFVSERRRKPPENLNYTKGCLRNGFGKVAARRRNRADCRNRADRILVAENFYDTRSFIEFRKAA